MHLDLSAALGRALPAPAPRRDGPAAPAPMSGRKAFAAATASRPVLQLSEVPVPLDPADYRDPYSNTNPQGDQRTLYALRALVDPVPEFDRTYRPSARSTEKIYQNLVRGASIGTGQDFAATVLAGARRTFEETALETLVVTPGKWHPVYATPDDWYDPDRTGRFQPVEIDLSGGGGDSGPFVLLPGQDRMRWRLGDPRHPELTKEPDGATEPASLRFRCLQVSLYRPWLDFEVFGLQGWYLQGQPQGYYSSGRTGTNPGVLPLLPTSLLIGTDVECAAHVGPDDRDLVRRAVASRTPLSLGPFTLDSITLADHEMRGASAGHGSAPPALHLIGWCSDLVPLSPATRP